VPGDPSRQGLFESADHGQSWAPSEKFSATAPISVLKRIGDLVFLAEGNRLYASGGGRSFEPIFSVHAFTEPEVFEAAEVSHAIHDVAAADHDCTRLWAGTSRGVFESLNCGGSWKPLATARQREHWVRVSR